MWWGDRSLRENQPRLQFVMFSRDGFSTRKHTHTTWHKSDTILNTSIIYRADPGDRRVSKIIVKNIPSTPIHT